MRSIIQWVGLFAGPILAAIFFFGLPTEYQNAAGTTVAFSSAGRATLAVMIWMATWWLTETIDLSATALLPLVLFPLLGIADMTSAAAPFAHPLVFLFIGGFLLAISMSRWGLDRRIALATLRVVGPRPAHMVGGFMLVTAVLSAFVSNTATTAMMLPIALSVVGLTTVAVTKERTPRDSVSTSASTSTNSTSTSTPSDGSSESDFRNFGTCLMLGIAYAASIGGVATIIGTPTNVFLISFLKDSIAEPYRVEFSFIRWMAIGVPFALVFLPIVWWLLTRVIYPVGSSKIAGGEDLIERQYQELGKTNRGEWVTLIVFCATAVAWILRPWLTKIQWPLGDEAFCPLANLTDTGIAMGGAMLLFVIPIGFQNRSLDFVMNWKYAQDLPWGVVLLFGGGLTLAAAVKSNGVAEFLGCQSQFAQGIPDIWLVLLVCVAIVFLTELTSNVATAATLIPVLAAMAPGLGIHPYLLIFPASIAASCAFMLPVATPPNAIVFASGEVTVPQMMKAGLWLNIVSVVLVTLLTFCVIKPLLGI